MPKYELFYFDVRGRAEVLRIMFAAKDVEYTDTRWTREEWPSHKADTPFGQLPVLSIDGNMFGQSIAMYNFVARELGFYGSSDLERLAIDQVVQLLDDFLRCFSKFFTESDEAKKAEIKKQFAEVDVPRYLDYLVKLLKANNNNGHFVGDSITLADIAAYEMMNRLETAHMMDFVKDTHGKVSDKYPEIQELNKRVLADPKIRAYVGGRKDTFF